MQSKLSSLSKQGMRRLSSASRGSEIAKEPQEATIYWVGDTAETCSLVTVRDDEALESDFMGELSIGTTVEITEIGEGRRVKVRTGNVEGWISHATRTNEKLIVKVCSQQPLRAIDDFEVGGQHEVKSLVTVRLGENLDTDAIGELRPGTVVKILQVGTENQRRALIQEVEGVSVCLKGWISLVTKQGEHLVGKKGSTSPTHSKASQAEKIKRILEAARAGDLLAIQQLVERRESVMSRLQQSRPPNLNSCDVRGKTTLIYATAFGRKNVVEYLLGKKGSRHQRHG
jgi:hypothetical protein